MLSQYFAPCRNRRTDAAGGAANDAVIAFDGSCPYRLQVGVLDGPPVCCRAQNDIRFQIAVTASQLADVVIMTDHPANGQVVHFNRF